jgi:hypothetical protein
MRDQGQDRAPDHHHGDRGHDQDQNPDQEAEEADHILEEVGHDD